QLISNTLLLPLLVATFLFSKRAKRHPTLVNVCITWIFSGFFSLLLFYAGQASGPEPQKALCIAQTTLLYGITPMWSVAVLVLLFNMLRVMHESHSPNPNSTGRTSRPMMFAMLAAPYIVQLAFSGATLAGAYMHPNAVTRARRVFYCALHLPALSLAMALFTAVVGVAIGALMVTLAVRLHRTWHTFRGPRGDSTLLLRVLVFGVYLAIGYAANIVAVVMPRSRLPDMYVATSGTVVFLVFGTQADVMKTWCFWRRERAPVVRPRERSWRYTIDLMQSVAPLPAETDLKEGAEREEEKGDMEKDEEGERSIAWGAVAVTAPPTVAAREERVR
ncbi:hypothetical protein DFH09DRAFT_1484920, partial [Mycena vulgaris]